MKQREKAYFFRTNTTVGVLHAETLLSAVWLFKEKYRRRPVGELISMELLPPEHPANEPKGRKRAIPGE